MCSYLRSSLSLQASGILRSIRLTSVSGARITHWLKRTAEWPSAAALAALLVSCSPGADRPSAEDDTATAASPGTVPVDDSTHLTPFVRDVCSKLQWRTCPVWVMTDDQRLNDGEGNYGPYAFI